MAMFWYIVIYTCVKTVMFIFFIIIAMMVGGEGIFFCGVVLGAGWVTGGGEGEKAERRKKGTKIVDGEWEMI